MREIEARFDWPWKGYLMWPPTVPTFCWPIGPCLAENRTIHVNLSMKYASKKQKTKKTLKNTRDPPGQTEKRENLGKTKSTGEPDAAKWFRKKACLTRKMIIIPSKHITTETATASAVKGWNREKTITTLGTAAPDWKKHWAVGESITRNIRYK